MDAKSLYDIVKDVDREAWPRGPSAPPNKYAETWWDGKCFNYGDSYSVEELSAPIAELLFVGSMVKWLAEECGPSTFTPVKHDDGNYSIHEYHDGTGYEISKHHSGPTLVEALAAACKAVKEDHP